MTKSSYYESVRFFIGVEIGKDTHHTVVVNRPSKYLFNKVLPNDENKLRSLISDFKQCGQILLPPSVRYPALLPALKALDTYRGCTYSAPCPTLAKTS
ncbi:transposase [Escherichia coli]|nr:transposase [Escherichia coli]